MDKIHIKGAKFYAYIGVTEKERLRAQEIYIDVTMHVKLSKVFQSDDIADTVNYVDVHETMSLEVCFHNQTIEHLAGQIADAIIAKYPVDRVDITLRKPNALAHKGVAETSVEITRSVE